MRSKPDFIKDLKLKSMYGIVFIGLEAFFKDFCCSTASRTYRDYRILSMRYVLGLTYKDIGRAYDLSPERIRMIINENLRSLRVKLSRKANYSYMNSFIKRVVGTNGDK